MVKLFANSGDPDQMPDSAASHLGLHCLPIFRGLQTTMGLGYFKDDILLIFILFQKTGLDTLQYTADHLLIFLIFLHKNISWVLIRMQ